MDQSSVGRYPGAVVPASSFMVGNSPFTDFLAATSPDPLPGRQVSSVLADAEPVTSRHGTINVGATFSGGVLIAGHRWAMRGNLIAQRDMEKVFADGAARMSDEQAGQVADLVVEARNH
jgi:hypothetical protein